MTTGNVGPRRPRTIVGAVVAVIVVTAAACTAAEPEPVGLESENAPKAAATTEDSGGPSPQKERGSFTPERHVPTVGASTPATGVNGDPSTSAPTIPSTSPLPGPTSPQAQQSQPACPPTAAGAQGVTDTELVIGAPRVTFDFAASSFDPPNHSVDEYVATMVDAVNIAGGIACRQIRIAWHDVGVDILSASAQQAACASWTQDAAVFAAIPVVDGPSEVLYPCLDRAGTLIVDVLGQSFRDAQGFAEVAHLLAVNSPRYDRAVAEQVHALVRQGFLGPDSTIGVAHYDDDVNVRVANEVLLPALATHGLSAQTRAITAPRGMADLPGRDVEVANVALRFNVQGVDRVLFVGGDGLAVAFMEAAENQGYRPRYGLHTVHLAAMRVDRTPLRQLHGARAIGWFPDSDQWPQPPDPSWPARTDCLDFYHAEGFDLSTALDRAIALSICEATWFFRTAVEATPGPLSPAAVLDAVANLGEQYRSPTVDRTRFGPDQRDGVTTYRDVAYHPDCRCFQSEGPERDLP